MTIKQLFLRMLLVVGLSVTILAVVPSWVVYAGETVVSDTTVKNPDGSSTETFKYSSGRTSTINRYGNDNYTQINKDSNGNVTSTATQYG
jgi:hypothetical protein